MLALVSQTEEAWSTRKGLHMKRTGGVKLARGMYEAGRSTRSRPCRDLLLTLGRRLSADIAIRTPAGSFGRTRWCQRVGGKGPPPSESASPAYILIPGERPPLTHLVKANVTPLQMPLLPLTYAAAACINVCKYR